MYCFERVGVYTFGSDVSSFVAFLSDQDSSNGIAEERDTIKFYKDIDAIEDDFPVSNHFLYHIYFLIYISFLRM